MPKPFNNVPAHFGNAVQTMSSREIADLTGKRHDNVMSDARKMLVELHGEGGLLKFQDTHRNEQNGQDYPILRLPKRETLILVSGYNVKMRAAIIDRWQELEAADAVRLHTPQAAASVARETRLTCAWLERVAKSAGISGNQALLSACQATERMTGVNPLGLLGISHMPAPQNDVLLTPTEIGRRIGSVSARTINLVLCGLGLQVAHRDAKDHIYYEPTDAGRQAGAVMQDTGKKHGTGTPVRQLKWSSSVIHLVDEAMDQPGAA